MAPHHYNLVCGHSCYAPYNRKNVSGQLSLYELVELLHQEALVAQISAKLLSDAEIQRLRQKSSHRVIACSTSCRRYETNFTLVYAIAKRSMLEFLQNDLFRAVFIIM
jgi:hypothetical protein